MITRASTRAQDGAAAVEFAVIMPILIMMFFGIIYFGLTIYRQQVVESATREAARVMAVGLPHAEIETALDGAAVGFSNDELGVVRYERDGADVGIPGTPPCDGDTTAATVVTNANGTRFDFTIPFWSGGRYDASFDSTATFRCEV